MYIYIHIYKTTTRGTCYEVLGSKKKKKTDEKRRREEEEREKSQGWVILYTGAVYRYALNFEIQRCRGEGDNK